MKIATEKYNTEQLVRECIEKNEKLFEDIKTKIEKKNSRRRTKLLIQK